MGPPTQTYSSTPPSKSRLPLKAFSLGVTTLGASSNASFSPQDSLAETDGKSTGYFLQFAQEKTPSPGKSKAAPKATKLPARSKVTGPKTPTRYPSGTPAQRTKLTKQQQARKVLPNRPVVKKVTSKELRQSPAQQADNKKHRGRPGKYLPKDGYRTRSVSPKVIGRRRRSSSPKPSGFRTRSISPKILKKEDLSKGLGKEDMLTVVDKCNNLLKNLTNEKEFLDAESLTLKSEQTIVNNCDSATAVCIDQPDSLSTIANEITDKRTNIDTNNAPSDKTHSSIQQVRPTTFIDAIEDNCINNEDISCESSFPSINIVTLPSTNIATLSADTSDTSSADTVDTVPNSDEWNTTEIKENTKHSSNDNNLTFHSLTGCQEERQPERDLHLDHEKIDDELSVAVPKSHGEVEDLKTNLDTPNLHSVSQSCKVESLSHSQNLPAEGIPANMASSWMDRLKEDLDNDEEWLSEEEEFQREQEEKLRAAAQRAESSSDDEQVGLRRPQSIPKKTDSRRDYHDDSLDSSDEEHQGFKYNHRNFAVRKSMNRPSYSTEDYSSEEELTMSSGARGGRAPPEPNHDEMDLMVKKNLAYVNPNELDKMDILTSDLDSPADQLRVESGVGEIISGEEEPYSSGDLLHTADGQIDIREGSEYDRDVEVSGSLEVVRDTRETDASVSSQYTFSADINSYSGAGKKDLHNKERDREELIHALAQDLIQTEKEASTDQRPTYSDVDTGYIPEEQLSPTEKDKEPMASGSHMISGYSTEVLRPSRNRDWRRQLSEKLNEWEDELPPVNVDKSDRLQAKDEAVTSFMAEEDENAEEDAPGDIEPTKPVLERSRSTEEELREKVEDSLHNKIRDWKNMTAESVTGQLDEWQSLGNFNVPPGKRRSHDPPCGDTDMPAEKKRDLLLIGREDSGEYADVNTSSNFDSYDDDADETDTGSKEMPGQTTGEDEEGDGYASDSSSQDTVRERIASRNPKGSVSDADSTDNIASNPSSSTASREDGLATEPGYVEILGGEEPPDEWLNLGSRRERIDSSSSSSDAGFQYISADRSPSYLQNMDRFTGGNSYEPETVDDYSVPDGHSRPRLGTPTLELPTHSHGFEPMQEDFITQSKFERQEHCPSPVDSVENEPTYDDVASPTSCDVTVHTSLPTEGFHSHFSNDLEPENEIEVVGRQRSSMSSPDWEIVEKPANDTELFAGPSSPDPAEPEIDMQTAADNQPEQTDTVETTDIEPPVPSVRTDSYERVEKLREEMRSSGKSKSTEIPNVRQSRSTERFTERMKSLEQTKALRDKRTPTPTGLTGKFSAAFSKFEPTDEKMRIKKSSSPLAQRKPSPVTVAPVTTVTVPKSAPLSSTPVASDEKTSEKGKPLQVKQEKTVEVEIVKPTVVKTVQASAPPESKPAVAQEPLYKASVSDVESTVSMSSETKPKRIERSKTFNTGVPTRASGAKVLERMAKFGQSVDVPKTKQAITTKNKDTERFERHTHVAPASQSSTQPRFDVDIQISRQPLPGQDNFIGHGYQGNTTAAITVSRDNVKVEHINKQPRGIEEVRKEEYFNVWDTEVPVTDGNKKVLMPRRLHVTSVSREIKPTNSKQSKSKSLNRSRSEPRLRKASSPQDQEISITVRPQISSNQCSEPASKYTDSTSDIQENARMRSSIALQPQDEVIPTRILPSYSARQYGSSSKSRSSGLSSKNEEVRDPPRMAKDHPQPQQARPQLQKGHSEPERDHPLRKADSLDELRSGQLVAQTKNIFNKEDPHAIRILPTTYNKVYSSARPETFVGVSSERSWDNRRKERQEMVSDAVRDLVSAYDQAEEVDSRHDYNIGYSRENLEYTRKWVENTEISQEIPPRPASESSQIFAQSENEKTADPVKDDIAYRRMQAANRRAIPKHFTTPSFLTLSSASPAPSVISDRGRARSTDRNGRDRPVGRPKGRSRSLPRKKASKAIADRLSVFSNEAPTEISYPEEIKPSSTRPLYSQSFSQRRSTSPRPVTQKEKLAARRSMPAPTGNGREEEIEQGSPRAPSKGVAMMVELYNKNKTGDSPLADVDEQTLGSVDDSMFNQRGAPPTPLKVVDDTPQSSQAWKTWLGQTDRSALEQKVEKVYNKNMKQQEAPPIKRESKPTMNSGWQQRSVHEELAIRPVHISQTQRTAPLASPPRPVKSTQAVEAQQRRAWSNSPPPPTLPQRGYSAEPQPQYPPESGYPHHEASAFDNYKQQSLNKFRQDEQYATVQRPRPGLRQQPPQQPPARPNSFDQALLLQAAPPKPERLYNTSELWDVYPPSEYPTTNSLHGYNQSKPSQYATHAGAAVDYKGGPRVQRTPSTDYTDHKQHIDQRQYPDPRLHTDPRQPPRDYYRDYPSQPRPTPRYDEQVYPQQQQPSYRAPDQGYRPPVKPNYQPSRDMVFDNRGYPVADAYSSYPADQVDSYRHNTVRKDSRYPHEQPPRGPIPDPRYSQTNGVRSPPPQQTDPRYGAFDPRLETGSKPKRTNSVPNIKHQITSPKGQMANTTYNPRYHDQYMEERAQQYPQHQRVPSSSGSGSLPRNSKKDKNRGKDNRNSAGLPEFIPIQYATGKYPTRPASQHPPQNYNYPQKHQNNNYPPAMNNNRYYSPSNEQAYPPGNHQHPSANGYPYSSNGSAYPANGSAYPTNGSAYPANGHGYPTNGHGYQHEDMYSQQRTRPGVGIIYNPELGISDF